MKLWIGRFWPTLTGLVLLAIAVAISPSGYRAQPHLWLVRGGFLLEGFLLAAGVLGLLLHRLRRHEKLALQHLDQLLLAQTTDRACASLPQAMPSRPWADICSRFSDQLDRYRAQLVELEAARASLELRARRNEARAEQVGAILSALPEPVIAIDNYDEVVLANDSAAKLFDISSQSNPQRALSQLLHCEKLVALLTETRGRRAPCCRTGEIEVSDSGGHAHAYSVTARTLGVGKTGAFDEDGAEGAVAVLRDISGQRALQKRNAEFVSSVSHEMKTPLAGIKAYVELLADGDAEDEKTEQEFLDVINSQADRLQRLIDNLLNLSRIEAGVVNVDKQSRSLNELLEEAYRVVQPLAEGKQIKLVKDLSPMYLGVFADRDMLLQAAINLLSNAVKYTPQGRASRPAQPTGRFRRAARRRRQRRGLEPRRLRQGVRKVLPRAKGQGHGDRHGPGAPPGQAHRRGRARRKTLGGKHAGTRQHL